MAVFAYTWTVLDKLPNTKLGMVVTQFDNLVRHAKHLRNLVYPA